MTGYGIMHYGKPVVVHEDVTPDRIYDLAAEEFDGDPMNLGLCIFCGFDEFCECDVLAGRCSMCKKNGVYSLGELVLMLRKAEVVLIKGEINFVPRQRRTE
jgi:hypothetical protein